MREQTFTTPPLPQPTTNLSGSQTRTGRRAFPNQTTKVRSLHTHMRNVIRANAPTISTASPGKHA
jgi:hypothetical protein